MAQHRHCHTQRERRYLRIPAQFLLLIHDRQHNPKQHQHQRACRCQHGSGSTQGRLNDKKQGNDKCLFPIQPGCQQKGNAKYRHGIFRKKRSCQHNQHCCGIVFADALVVLSSVRLWPFVNPAAFQIKNQQHRKQHVHKCEHGNFPQAHLVKQPEKHPG